MFGRLLLVVPWQFGRCICGDGMRGNMGYFKVILVCSQLGPMTMGISVLISLIMRFGGAGVGIAAAIYVGACVVGSAAMGFVHCNVRRQARVRRTRRGAHEEISSISMQE